MAKVLNTDVESKDTNCNSNAVLDADLTKQLIGTYFEKLKEENKLKKVQKNNAARLQVNKSGSELKVRSLE